MNYTEEEKKQHHKFSMKVWNNRPDVKERHKLYSRKWRDENRQKVRESDKRFYESHRTQRIALIHQYNKRPCRDPLLNDVISYNTLIARRRKHPDLYEGTPSPKECLIHIPKIRGLEQFEKEQAAKTTEQ